MTELISQINWMGIVIGVSTFLIIGLFHPIVIKGEYYFGTRCWWWFAVAGVALIVAALLVESVLASALLGVTGFSSFWSILEIFEQQARAQGLVPAQSQTHLSMGRKRQKMIIFC